MTDDQLRKLWRHAGGDFHGPIVEKGTMPEEKLLPFMRMLLGVDPVRLSGGERVETIAPFIFKDIN